jgi:penicillin amidase
MKLSAKEILKRLGAGESITKVCTTAGISRGEFDTLWQAEIRARVPEPAGRRRADVHRSVRIDRDSCGIPHIYADTDEDLFFGFGYALAQDRLFQLDYLRRRGSGRLAEILGADGAELDLLGRVAGIQSVLELDLLNRTVGIRRIAEAEWNTLADEPRALLAAFSHGVNALMEESRERLPIEFDLLDYRPEPWSPVDCLTIEGEFRWYLTGRFPVIVIPELAKRVLGDGPLYRAFLQAEDGDESILPSGSYSEARCGTQPVGVAAAYPESREGSNNWVLAGRRTDTGKPLLASDPHIAFDAVSCWYEVHLHGGSFNVAGAAYVGMPGVLFGRNERVAWGCTNNICSQRDLCQEKTDPAHPNCFYFDGRWEPARKREEIIIVRGSQPVRKMILYSRNGPIVDEVLPPLARQTGPVALKWLGAYQGGWLTALLAMNRAHSAADFRAALEPWYVPTFNVVFADVDGHIGYQTTGRIPLRRAWERGYRPGWDPEHQWQGLIPFDGMPRLSDPEQGWIATANNRVAPDDYPYPLSGTWGDGHRARRIRQMIEAKPRLSRDDFSLMHRDALSLRALRTLPCLLNVLASATDSRIGEAVTRLRAWDGRMEPDRTGAAIFEVFFSHWTRAVVHERFDDRTAAFLSGGASGLAAGLLLEDANGWFVVRRRDQVIMEAIGSALDWLTNRLGSDMSQWTWGKLHILSLRHVLSGRGDLGQLLDHGGRPVPGNAHTVCNTGPGSNFESRTGANYRLIADLNTAGLWAVDSQSQSGHPGSPHYSDQFQTWLKGEYHSLPLEPSAAARTAACALTLEPANG